MSAASSYQRRWLILALVATAQLMIVLDLTIVNIALPSAQADLGISVADRQWVVTAYTLAFGGLLLLGGRIADYTVEAGSDALELDVLISDDEYWVQRVGLT